MKLALDHHYSPKIAEQLRTRGHDTVAAKERGWEECDDESLLGVSTAEGRDLVTNNVGDFTVIARRWATEPQPRRTDLHVGCQHAAAPRHDRPLRQRARPAPSPAPR